MNPQLGRSTIAVLAFHKIGKAPFFAKTKRWYIPEKSFRNHLCYLSSNGWDVISIDTFLKALSAQEGLPQRAVLLTFDDGYKSLLNFASACLREFGYPSVVFVPTHFVGKYNDFDRGKEPREAICNWDDLRELDRHGCSIQSHGVWHRAFAELAPEEQAEELNRSKRLIEIELGKSVEVFAYPYGQVRPDQRGGASELLQRAGYRAAFMFGGGVSAYPTENTYFLPRVDMYPDSDLASLLRS